MNRASKTWEKPEITLCEADEVPYPEEALPKGWHAFDLVDVDGFEDVLIRDGGLMNRIGSLATSRDILDDAVRAHVNDTREEDVLYSELGRIYAAMRFTSPVQLQGTVKPIDGAP